VNASYRFEAGTPQHCRCDRFGNRARLGTRLEGSRFGALLDHLARSLQCACDRSVYQAGGSRELPSVLFSPSASAGSRKSPMDVASPRAVRGSRVFRKRSGRIRVLANRAGWSGTVLSGSPPGASLTRRVVRVRCCWSRGLAGMGYRRVAPDLHY
jgi:hypothetical protein